MKGFSLKIAQSFASCSLFLHYKNQSPFFFIEPINAFSLFRNKMQ